MEGLREIPPSTLYSLSHHSRSIAKNSAACTLHVEGSVTLWHFDSCVLRSYPFEMRVTSRFVFMPRSVSFTVFWSLDPPQVCLFNRSYAVQLGSISNNVYVIEKGDIHLVGKLLSSTHGCSNGLVYRFNLLGLTRFTIIILYPTWNNIFNGGGFKSHHSWVSCVW